MARLKAKKNCHIAYILIFVIFSKFGFIKFCANIAQSVQ